MKIPCFAEGVDMKCVGRDNGAVIVVYRTWMDKGRYPAANSTFEQKVGEMRYSAKDGEYYAFGIDEGDLSSLEHEFMCNEISRIFNIYRPDKALSPGG